jgi:hypothetical protein
MKNPDFVSRIFSGTAQNTTGSQILIIFVVLTADYD